MKLYQKVIDTWGRETQLKQAIEECSELIHAICKEMRYGSSNIEEEIADVEIMIAQLRLMVNTELVETWKKAKIERLEEILRREG